MLSSVASTAPSLSTSPRVLEAELYESVHYDTRNESPGILTPPLFERRYGFGAKFALATLLA